MSVTLGLITDIHHGLDSEYVRGSVALPLFEDVLTQLEAHNPALLVDLGDRINDVELEQARAELREVAHRFRKLSVPGIHLLGNHDVTTLDEQEKLLGVPLGNQSLELGGWQLVFLDTFDGSVEGALSSKTLGWLGQTLSETILPTVVFSHQPLDGEPLRGNPFFDGASSYQAHLKGHVEARRIMERSEQVKLAVSGHAHWNHQVKVNGIHYLTLDALVPLLGGEARRYLRSSDALWSGCTARGLRTYRVELGNQPVKVRVASAGTGKTTSLVRRYLELTREGVPLRRIAGVTFTNAAAAELRQRVGAGVREALATGSYLELSFTAEDKPKLAAAERELGGATLSTIHGFMGGALRLTAPLLGLDPDFSVLGEWEGTAVFEEELKTLLYLAESPQHALYSTVQRAGRDAYALTLKLFPLTFTYRAVQRR